jgi:hypothetical protein
MKKPENFIKIDNEVLKIKSQSIRIDVCNSPDGFFVFQDNGGPAQTWNNAVLFEMDWANDKYNVKICVLGDGVDGWYLHSGLPIPKSLMKTVNSFKQFVEVNMLDVASKVCLYNMEPNTMGETELEAVEISHTVASSSGPTSYIVTENVGGLDGLWSCTCPAYQYSKSTPQTCKHIKQLNP